MITAHVSRPTATGHGVRAAAAMVTAVVLSVLLLVVAGLDRPSDATPMRPPQVPVVEAVPADTGSVGEPAAAPAPAPQPSRVR